MRLLHNLRRNALGPKLPLVPQRSRQVPVIGSYTQVSLVRPDRRDWPRGRGAVAVATGRRPAITRQTIVPTCEGGSEASAGQPGYIARRPDSAEVLR